MSQRVFCTCVLPENLIRTYGLSNAGCHFSFNLMSGGFFDKAYSNLNLFVGGELPQEAYADKRFQLVYSSMRKYGKLGRWIGCFIEQWRMYSDIERDSNVWFYNLTSLNAVLFLLLKLLKPSVRLNVIVLDFTPSGRLTLNYWFLKLINKAHGNILLSYSELFTNPNKIILPGVVPQSDEVCPKIFEPSKSFLLSGVLFEEISMLTMVLEAFSQMPDCDLYITGSKGNIQLAKVYSDKYPNIHYIGEIPFNEYLNLLHKITFQLSTRDIRFPENQCNFPSKIIEALLHNRAIVSTIHYPQLDGIKYFEVNDSVALFVKEIKRITSIPKDSLMTYVNQGEYVRKLFSTDVWLKTMQLIENYRK